MFRCRCVRYDSGDWRAKGCRVVNNLLLGVDRHVDCSCQPDALGYAVLVDAQRSPSTVGYTIYFHVSCFICVVRFTTLCLVKKLTPRHRAIKMSNLNEFE